MAFKIENFGSEIANIKPIVAEAPRYWVYFNEDNDTVTTAGFIPKETVASIGIKAGDRIRVIPGTKTNKDVEYHAVISAAGVLTITAFAA